MPKLTRREFARLLALSLAGTAAAGAAGLPALGGRALAAPGGKGTPGALDPALPLHPLLQYGARIEPDKVVRVIVQTARPEHDGRKLAADNGAAHLEEFAFVKAHHLEIKQGKLPGLALHPHVLYISPDAAVEKHGTTIDASKLKTTYPLAIRADAVWNSSPSSTGAGVAVAVLDTGLNAAHPDFASAAAGTVRAVNANPRAASAADAHGHGTHVAGILKGRSADGAYIGIAPDCTLIGVKIADDSGRATTADLLRGLQWCYDNRAAYNLRVASLSITAGTAESYRTSPVCAAAEQLWRAGVVVVVAAGNRSNGADATWYAPANDPYVITVGALDDGGTAGPGDDNIGVFSSRGTTQDNLYKPDLVAPGRRIVSTLAASTSTLAKQFPDRVTADKLHLRLSGTSMAAPVVAGVVALVLQRNPTMTPDQVKWLLGNVAHPYATAPDAVRVVNPVEAMTTATSSRGKWQSANQGLTPNNGINPATGTVDWRAAYWDAAYWDAAYWDAAYWDVCTYD